MINVFIVDDDVSILKLYKAFLNPSKFKILDSANNGIQALSKYQSLKIKPDVIIMDYQMPLKNGIEAMREILHLDKTTRIILVSGDTSIEEKAISNGASGFIAKPFDLNYFCHKIITVYNYMGNNKINSSPECAL